MAITIRSHPYSKKFLLSASIISLATVVSLSYFFTRLATIKKDTPRAVYAVDFISYYTAAQLIKTGEISEIYAAVKDDFSVVNSGKFFETARRAGFALTPTRYVYLPIFLAPFTLFTACSYPTAALLWLMVNLCAITAVIVLEWSLTSDLPHPLLRLMVITSLNLGSFPLFYALKLGQTSILVYLILCLILYLTVAGKDHFAGILLGVITVLKYSPLLLILYFLYRRRYGLVISSTVTGLALILLSLLLYGLPLHTMYWEYFRELSGIGIAAWSNQSIDAFFLRLITSDSIFHFSPIQATTPTALVSYACALSMIGVVCLFFRKNGKVKSTPLYLLEFSALILCLLIVPTISWLHYFMVATLSIILTISLSWRNYSRQLRLVVPLTAICYLMISLHPDYTHLAASFGQGLYTRVVVSFPLLGTCLLLLINLLMMKKSQNHPR